MEKDYGYKNYAKSILAGGVAGIAVDLVLFPLDTIKTRIQATIRGTTPDFVKKATNISKYRGLQMQIYASFPAAAAFFSTYDLIKYLLIKKFQIFTNKNGTEYLAHMIAAVFGEAAQVIFRNPFELVKQNLQIGKYKNAKEAILEIYITYGVKGLYRGYFITVLREIPFGLIQYPLYEYLKKNKKNTNINSTPFDYSLCGAKAGAISAFLTTPIDVVKTRIMTENTSNKNIFFDVRKIFPKIKSIYLNEGILKFFSGVHIRVTYISIGGMIFFGSNEFLKKQIYYI